MSRRTYKLMSMPPGRKDQAVVEIITDEAGSEQHRKEFMGLLPGTPGETAFDVVQALNGAYQAGREDRSEELLKPMEKS